MNNESSNNQPAVQKKDDDYPAYLTIFLNTRIIGHTKEIYTPSMTIPTISSSSKRIYFNPLIKLNKNIVETIPKGKSENFVYEQFFNSNLFNSLMIRSQYYPQPKRTTEQASKEGIIDNNIEIILELLFSQNKPFYIDKKRYTSYGYKYKKGSWIVESINSSELKKNFYNYYQSNINALIRRPYRYNIPTANIQPMVPNTFMITPSGQTITYPYQPYQPYPYQPNNISLQTENPIFGTFNSFKKNMPDDVLHGPAASEVFGNIVKPTTPTTPAPSTVSKKTRITADKSIALQSKSLATTSPNQSTISNINKLNSKYYNTLIEQYLFYSYDGFKKGFINIKNITCSKINTVDALTTIRKGDFYKNKIESWDILYNEGGGDCLFYAFCQILNSSDYKKYNIPLKNRRDLFQKTPNINYYDKNNNYTVFGLRNIIADFIRYTNMGNDIWNYMNNSASNNANDSYIVKNNLDATLNNIKTCAHDKNRTLYGQKPLGDQTFYYWGDNISIMILEYIFELKTIIIYKPNDDINDEVEIYNKSENVTSIDSKTQLLDYIKVEYVDVNKTANTITGYLIKKDFNTNNKYMTILKNNDNEDTCTFIKQNIDVNTVNTIYKVSKYTIYRTGNTYALNNNRVYEKYFYLFYHENTHYEAMIFNIRDNPRYVFEDIDIYNFHPYILYMIYLYNYMLIDNTNSDFFHSSINEYLNAMKSYFNDNKKDNKRKQFMPLLGGDGNNGVNNSNQSNNTSSFMDRFFLNYFDGDKILKNIDNISTNITSNINNKLNEQLDIKSANTTNNSSIPTYYANPNMSYYIVVDLELFPGDSISLADKKNLACQIQFDNIRKSYADFLGYQYQPSLLNTSVMPTSIDTKSYSSDKNKTKNNKYYNKQNKSTRKNR
jgi:hypothetical protein